MDHPTPTEPPGSGPAPGTPPAQEAGNAAPPHAHDTSADCPNCGAPLAGPFCAQCGQRAAIRLVSVRAIMTDALEDQLSLNAALPRTLGALFLHPGKLTADYVSGRIARYIPPMRLYLGASLLFFLALSFVATPRALREAEREDAARAARANATADAGRIGAAASPGRVAAAPAAGAVATPPAGAASPAAAGKVDTILSSGHGSLTIRVGEDTPEWLERRLRAQQARLSAMSRQDALRVLLGALFNAAPKVVFVLLPLFALILKLLYVRRRRLYAEHFVFALHIHALAFAAFTVMLLARNMVVDAVLATWLALYCLLAMRRVYGQGWVRTTAKCLALGVAYLFVVAMGAAMGTVVALLSI